MGGSLVGQHVYFYAAAGHFRKNFGAVAQQPYGKRLLCLHGLLRQGEGFVQAPAHYIHIGRGQALLYAGLVRLYNYRHPPFIVTARGWAPPIPPRPPVTISLPDRSLLKCLRAQAEKVS